MITTLVLLTFRPLSAWTNVPLVLSRSKIVQCPVSSVQDSFQVFNPQTQFLCFQELTFHIFKRDKFSFFRNEWNESPVSFDLIGLFNIAQMKGGVEENLFVLFVAFLVACCLIFLDLHVWVWIAWICFDFKTALARSPHLKCALLVFRA